MLPLSVFWDTFHWKSNYRGCSSVCDMHQTPTLQYKRALKIDFSQNIHIPNISTQFARWLSWPLRVVLPSPPQARICSSYKYPLVLSLCWWTDSKLIITNNHSIAAALCVIHASSIWNASEPLWPEQLLLKDLKTKNDSQRRALRGIMTVIIFGLLLKLRCQQFVNGAFNGLTFKKEI